MSNEFIVIPDFPKYEINHKGEVRNVRTKQILKHTFRSKKGYPMVILYRGWQEPHGKNIHRLVAKVFIPNPHNFKYVNHIDGDKKNCHVENLEWCTCSHNALHAQAMGLNDLRGEKHPGSKLKTSQVLEIHQLIKKGLSQNTIAKKFGIVRQTVSDIHCKRRWAHLKQEEE